MTVAMPETTSAASPSASSAAGRRLLDELAALLLPVVMPVVRRLPALILVAAAVISLMGVLALVAAQRDDARIEEHSAVATAEVLPGSDFSRTLVSFTTADGETVTPERGVYYPRGLRPGQLVRVEYDSTHPERVRVLGRDASVGKLPVALLLVVTWAIALPIAFTLRGRQLRQIEATQQALAEALAVKQAVAAEAAAVRGATQAAPAREPVQRAAPRQPAPRPSAPRQSAPRQSAPRQSAPRPSAPGRSAPRQ